MAQVNLDVGENKITAVITRDVLDALGLQVGDRAIALMKATEVMVSKETYTQFLNSGLKLSEIIFSLPK